MSKLSVIVPVYGVEKYIERCAVSLFEQSLDDVEFIFVDDLSPDKSIEILETTLERYPTRKPFVKVIRHSQNRGLPAARNTGLANAQGEYIYHCDSDDYLEVTALEQMYNVADTTGAEIVWCDYFLTFSSKERIMVQPGYANPEEAVIGMLSGKLKYNVWNKLVKRYLYYENNIRFPEGYCMGEDMTMIRLTLHAKSITNVNEPLYHYVRQNSGAMTQSYSESKIAEMIHNVNQTIDYISDNSDEDFTKEFAFFKLSSKLPLLINEKTENYRRWNSLFPEANRYILANKYQSIRTRALEWLASYKLYVFIRLYNIVFYRILYAIRYR